MAAGYSLMWLNHKLLAGLLLADTEIGFFFFFAILNDAAANIPVYM